MIETTKTTGKPRMELNWRKESKMPSTKQAMIKTLKVMRSQKKKKMRSEELKGGNNVM